MTACYLCGSTSHRECRGCVRDDSSLKVLECNACGLVFLSSIDHIHPSHYAESGMHGEQPLPVENWLQVTDADDERRFRYLRQMLVGKKLLDFGCGAGGFCSRRAKWLRLPRASNLNYASRRISTNRD